MNGHKCPKCGTVWGRIECFEGGSYSCSRNPIICNRCGGMPLTPGVIQMDPFEQFVLETREDNAPK